MDKFTVKASLAFEGIAGAPSQIVYLPEGTHTIHPENLGEPITLTVSKDILPAFQENLAARLAKPPRPYLDFDHKRGAASALPTSFEWVEGKGLVLNLEWTPKGKRSIEGKEFSYFSPEFIADLEAGVPIGLAARGPLGGLVNEPAFENIPRIAAKKTAASSNKPNKETMDANALVLAGVLTKSESESDNCVSVAAQRITDWKTKAGAADEAAQSVETLAADLKKTKDELVALQAKIKEAADARIESAIKAAREDGRIDEDQVEFWKTSLETQGDPAFAALEKLAAKNGHLRKDVVAAKSGHKAPSNPILDALSSNKDGKKAIDVISAAARKDPEAYERYRESLGLGVTAD